MEFTQYASRLAISATLALAIGTTACSRKDKKHNGEAPQSVSLKAEVETIEQRLADVGCTFEKFSPGPSGAELLRVNCEGDATQEQVDLLREYITANEKLAENGINDPSFTEKLEAARLGYAGVSKQLSDILAARAEQNELRENFYLGYNILKNDYNCTINERSISCPEREDNQTLVISLESTKTLLDKYLEGNVSDTEKSNYTQLSQSLAQEIERLTSPTPPTPAPARPSTGFGPR